MWVGFLLEAKGRGAGMHRATDSKREFLNSKEGLRLKVSTPAEIIDSWITQI